MRLTQRTQSIQLLVDPRHPFSMRLISRELVGARSWQRDVMQAFVIIREDLRTIRTRRRRDMWNLAFSLTFWCGIVARLFRRTRLLNTRRLIVNDVVEISQQA